MLYPNSLVIDRTSIAAGTAQVQKTVLLGTARILRKVLEI